MAELRNTPKSIFGTPKEFLVYSSSAPCWALRVLGSLGAQGRLTAGHALPGHPW